MARWQAVHREGRAVHLAHADRQERGAGVSSQPAQGVVLQTAGRQHQRRLRGYFRAERAAAQPAGAAGERFFGRVSLPRPASDHGTKPIGTGPFKFVEFKRGASIRLIRNPDYWKKDRPYLDEITFRMIDSRATRMLAFATGDFDITFPSDVSVPLMKDMKARAPKAICEMITTGT